MSALAIFGSSRDKGETWNALELVLGASGTPIVNLRDLHISEYDYDNSNADDDFFPLAERMLSVDLILLATPVYWYASSARMKLFIDRWTDLLDVRPDMGRRLRGKSLAVVASYAEHPKGKEGFEPPFALTASYLGMNYKGCFFYYSGSEMALRDANALAAAAFAKSIGLAG